MTDTALQTLVDLLCAYDARALPLTPVTSRLRERVAASFDPDVVISLDEALTRAHTLLRDGITHSTHPRHMGLFIPTTDLASVVADALVAHFNPQLSVRAAAPAAVEMEHHTLAAFAQRLGFDPATTAMHFTTGGAEANHSALVCALARAVPTYPREGLCAHRVAVYASEASHASITKAAQVTGVGAANVRRIAVDRRGRMRVDALEAAFGDDHTRGIVPVMVVATAGTTAVGAIDPLREVLDATARVGAWGHVDAAWGGLAALSPATRTLLDGIERADSVTWDAHKALPVAMGAGMFFTREIAALRAVFAVDAPYVMRHENDEDPYATSLQWSRRFMGLKVLLTLVTRGWSGLRTMVERQFALADRLREGARSVGWQVVNDTALPVVCVTHPRLRAGTLPARKAMLQLWRDGVAWVSTVQINGKVPALRACITHVESTEHDVDALVSGLRSLVARP